MTVRAAPRVDEGLESRVRQLADELEIPGVAVGIFHEGAERYAYNGVTSIENPLPVDDDTLFQFGSTGKTYTSVCLLRLVEDGNVDLDAPVRRYVPELKLRDRDVAERVTVLQLLNHTAGWDGDFFEDTGEGDDALARYVERMVSLKQLTPPGSIASYNNASLSLAGRIIEKITGVVYERAVKDLVLDPVGMTMTMFFTNDIMSRRFVVGHRRETDGTIRVLRPWAMHRSGNAMGGLSATAPDQIRWARFHIDRGRTVDGEQVVASELIERMQQATAEMPGSALGDAVGISWLLSEAGGEKVVAHGGSTTGQYAGFAMVPARRFAVVSLTNAEPNGPLFNRRIKEWALETYLGIVEPDPIHEPRSAEALADYAGSYETVAELMTITVEGDHLVMDGEPKPELIAQLGEDADYREPPMPMGMLPGDGDRFIVPSGPHEGSKGFFTRDTAGRIEGIHAGGRYAPRVQG
jgi:CubicO group peptidase (beta-lactamase class C family)